MACAEKGDFEMVDILYEAVKRLPPEIKRSEITGALFRAVRKEMADVVGLLVLDDTVDATCLNGDGETLLTAAVKTGNKRIVNKFMLLKNIQDVINAPNKDGQTPMDIALERKDRGICLVLENNGAKLPYDSQ